MSYWSHHPELLDRITTEALPEPWRKKVEDEDLDLLEVPEDVLYCAMDEATREWAATQVDITCDAMEDERRLIRRVEERGII